MEDGSEFGDGRARREGFFRGNRVMMRIPCACSLRGLSVGSVVEYEESEQALNLTVTLKVLKQQSFKKMLGFFWPGPNYMKAKTHQGEIRAGFKTNKSIYCKYVKVL